MSNPYEEVIEEVKPKEDPTPPKKVSKPKRKTTASKKPKPKKTAKTKPQTAPKEETAAPTTVGIGEFSVTIRFNKPATLKCGDGQSKDFVNQTKMTFKTRTACRINTEDGEQGALSASKSGTIQCSLSGTVSAVDRHRLQLEDLNMSDTQRTDQDITTEIQTLFGFIDELNYYEMFCLSPDCVQSDIPLAYKAMVDRFDPLNSLLLTKRYLEQGDYLMLSFQEAFETLNSASSRLEYDVLMSNGQLRIEDTKLAQVQEQNNNDLSSAAMTENGKKYWMLALEAFENKDFHSALLQVGFALQYESSNETFKEFKAQVEVEAKKAPKANNNPYKIRL